MRAVAGSINISGSGSYPSTLPPIPSQPQEQPQKQQKEQQGFIVSSNLSTEKELEIWRETSSEYERYVAARNALRDARSKYSALAATVNEAKRMIDAQLAEGIPAVNTSRMVSLGGGGEGDEELAAAAVTESIAVSAAAETAAVKLLEAKTLYKTRYEAANLARIEVDYAQSNSDALGKVCAMAFQEYMKARR
jgi:hypothetical protein